MQIWAIQTKLKLDDSSIAVAEACQKLSLSWAGIPVVPFKKYIPDLKWDGPVFYYGSIRLLRNVRSSPKHKKSAVLFDDPEKFSCSYYGPILGELWLNHGAEIITVKDFLKRKYSGQIFTRPNSCDKSYSGLVETEHYIKSLIISNSIKNKTLKNNSLILVNENPSDIIFEYRTWIVEGKVCAIVGYRRGGKVDPWELDEYSDEYLNIKIFAENASPNLELEAFVLDVAVTKDGFKVVELNDVHCSGFYRNEHIINVVAELSNYIAKYKSDTGRR